MFKRRFKRGFRHRFKRSSGFHRSTTRGRRHTRRIKSYGVSRGGIRL